jgi:hypothetical protein
MYCGVKYLPGNILLRSLSLALCKVVIALEKSHITAVVQSERECPGGKFPEVLWNFSKVRGARHNSLIEPFFRPSWILDRLYDEKIPVQDP